MPIIVVKYTRQEQNVPVICANDVKNGGMKRLTIDGINKVLNVRSEIIQKYRIMQSKYYSVGHPSFCFGNFLFFYQLYFDNRKSMFKFIELKFAFLRN